MENQIIDLFKEQSGVLMFSESDCSKTFDDMINDSYLSHPTNMIFNLNCIQTKSEACHESKNKILNNILAEVDTVLLINQNTYLNTNEIKNNYSEKNRKQTKSENQKYKWKTKNKEKCDKVNRLKTSKTYETSFEDTIKSITLEDNKNLTSQYYESDHQNKNLDVQHQSEFNSNKIKTDDYLPNRTVKFKRWGTKEDIKMFKILRKDLAIMNMDEEDLFNLNIDDILDHNSKTIKDQMFENLTNKLTSCTNWSRTPYHLLYRILRLCNNQEFSVRQEMLLRSLLSKRSKVSQMDLRKISELFPGKLASSIQNKIRDINSQNY